MLTLAPLGLIGTPNRQNQQWNFDGMYIRSGTNNELCIDVPNGDYSNGNKLEIWQCNGHTNQQWKGAGDQPPAMSGSANLPPSRLRLEPTPSPQSSIARSRGMPRRHLMLRQSGRTSITSTASAPSRR